MARVRVLAPAAPVMQCECGLPLKEQRVVPLLIRCRSYRGLGIQTTIKGELRAMHLSRRALLSWHGGRVGSRRAGRLRP